ncbi:S1C family serine protease [Methylibium sp.]|uniref:S1C family serine protease n=1 Tax=Methylibium sp. TaxID=2067992 RepID=UPI003D09CD7F
MASSRTLAVGMALALALGLSAGTVSAAPALHVDDAPPSGVTQQRLALKRASDAVLGLLSTATEDASSIDTLGEQRSGSGVVIGNDGLVLTIGYLILEAEDVELVLDSGKRMPARVVAYDLASGFGLVQALVPLGVEPVQFGQAQAVAEGEPLLVVSGGDEGALSAAQLVSRRSYSGYWEYHIDGALFTSPPRTDHSGAGLFNARGELIGIGSLLVPDAQSNGPRRAGNMFVPVDLLSPIFTELREHGLSRASMRAWLGVNCVEQDDGLRVLRVSRDSPAETAGVQPGDLIRRLDGTPVGGLESFYKMLWNGGSAERDIALEVLRDGHTQTVPVHSVDRMRTFTRARGI